MLQANPNLGYRDVQQILAYSTKLTGRHKHRLAHQCAHDWNGEVAPTLLHQGVDHWTAGHIV